jgi:hypothetical protein
MTPQSTNHRRDSGVRRAHRKSSKSHDKYMHYLFVTVLKGGIEEDEVLYGQSYCNHPRYVSNHHVTTNPARWHRRR